MAEFQGEPVMFPNRLTIGALAVACVAAAGVGGYLASRQNAAAAPAATVAASAPASEAAALNRPVQETEAVVAPQRAGAGGGTLGTTTATARRVEAARRSTTSTPATPATTATTTGTKSAGTPARTNPPLERPWPSTPSQSPAASVPHSPA